MKGLMVKLLLIVLLPCLLGAGDYAPPEVFAKDPKLPPGYDESKAIRLDLDGAIVLALRNNLNIIVDRDELRTTELSEGIAKWSMYEPQLSADVSHGGENRPPTSAQAGVPGSTITSNSDSWGLSISQGLPTGAHASIGLSSSRTSSTSGTAVEPLNYTSTLTFGISQPLFRGFSWDLVIPRYEQITARIATEQERHHFAISAATLIQQTESAYWDVVYELYSYNVTAKSLQAAEDTFELAKRQVAAGIGSPSDITGAETQFARRKIDVLSAAASVERAWDALRTIMNLPHDQWSKPLMPTDRPHYDPSTTVPSEDEAYKTAVAHRLEIKDLDLDIESADLALRKAKNDNLPSINLDIQGSVFGQDQHWGGALSQVGGHADTGWSIGLGLTWTPLGKVAKANNEIARIKHDMSATNREIKLQGIWSEVRNAVRAQRAASLEVVAAAQSRKVATENLEIETRKYQSGTLQNLAIANAQNALADAELTELRTVIGHVRATTDVLLATGQLLDHRHVALEVGGVR